jgi:hypothetical protein
VSATERPNPDIHSAARIRLHHVEHYEELTEDRREAITPHRSTLAD